jgi:hypothetical protein
VSELDTTASHIDPGMLGSGVYMATFTTETTTYTTSFVIQR